MPAYAYRLVNVFTQGRTVLSGNPLCVFERAQTLDDARMQALALQFNLSETTFILPSERASARVRLVDKNGVVTSPPRKVWPRRDRATDAFHLSSLWMALCNDCAAAGSPCVKYVCFGGDGKALSQRISSLFPACAENCPSTTISAFTTTSWPNNRSDLAPSCNARPRVPCA